MQLTWSFSFKSIRINDAYCNKYLELFRGENEGIIAKVDNLKFSIDSEDIKYVQFNVPKLLKKGSIIFLDSEKQILEYVVDGREVKLGWVVQNADKDIFYGMYNIFKNNGFEVLVL